MGPGIGDHARSGNVDREPDQRNVWPTCSFNNKAPAGRALAVGQFGGVIVVGKEVASGDELDGAVVLGAVWMRGFDSTRLQVQGFSDPVHLVII